MATKSEIISIINRIAPYAQKYAKKYGYHVCSPCIAQALQESLGKYEGLSLLAYKYHNFHGIKAYPKWTGNSINLKTGEEYTRGTITNIRSNFCVFDSEEDGVEQYFIFLELNPRYKNLKACITPEEYLKTIRADGYCTSFSYVSSCIGKIRDYNLTAYDDFQYQGVISADTYIVGQIYTLDSNMYLRSEPFGEKMKFSCITSDAQAHGHFDDFGCAILDKGTRVTCRDVKKLTDSTWILIPSGWICAERNGKVYVK